MDVEISVCKRCAMIGVEEEEGLGEVLKAVPCDQESERGVKWGG